MPCQHNHPSCQASSILWKISTQKATKNKFRSSTTSQKIQDRETIHMSSSHVNNVPPMANMALDMETLNPPQPPLSPVYSETKGIEPVVNPCTEAWTNASCYWATVKDTDSDEESDGEEGEDSSSSDSDSSDDGLGIEDTINDEFEWELGNFDAHLKGPFILQFGDNGPTVEELTDEELAYLRHYTLKVETHMTNDTFSKLVFAFPKSTIGSWKITKARAKFLATFRPVAYDCCISSCCCFVGPNGDLMSCPYCHEPPFNSKGWPQRWFTYAPLIPWLLAFYRNKEFGHPMLYWSRYQPDGTNLQDVMDSENYQRLHETHVTINGQPCPYRYFQDPRDIALGLSTDVFCLFWKHKKTCWPILIYNYNLPPEIHFWICHILCIGIVPGLYKPKDFNSFLWPLVEELLKLTAGINAFDLSSDEIFALRAFLILVFGDIPAVSMVMQIKGHNGLVPCQMCKIMALRTPNSFASTLCPTQSCSTSCCQGRPLRHPGLQPSWSPLMLSCWFSQHCPHCPNGYDNCTIQYSCKKFWHQRDPHSFIPPVFIFPQLLSLWFHAPYFQERHEEFNSPLDWWIQGPQWRKWQLSPHAQSLGSSWHCNCSRGINHSLCIWSSTPKCLWQ